MLSRKVSLFGQFTKVTYNFSAFLNFKLFFTIFRWYFCPGLKLWWCKYENFSYEFNLWICQHWDQIDGNIYAKVSRRSWIYNPPWIYNPSPASGKVPEMALRNNFYKGRRWNVGSNTKCEIQNKKNGCAIGHLQQDLSQNDTEQHFFWRTRQKLKIFHLFQENCKRYETDFLKWQ